jgi:hypothetical protein
MARSGLWTDEETAILRQMMAAARSLPEIMEKLQRSKYSIKERWRWINHTEEHKILRRKQINLNRHIRSQFGTGASFARNVPAREIPEDVTSNRAARINAGPRDLAGAFFGDPPRGFSALDRKLSGDRDPAYIDRRLAQLQRKPSLAWGPAE